MSVAETIVTGTGALLTLMIFSLLYRENPFSRFAEHLFLGVGAAYWMVMGFWFTLVPNLLARIFPPALGALLPAVEPSEPDLSYVVPLGLGILMLTQLRDATGRLGSLPLAFAAGFAAGTAVTRFLRSDLVDQLRACWLPLVVYGSDGGLDIVASLRHLTVVGGTLSGLLYFLFARRNGGAVGRAARAGRLFLMVAFGTTLGHAAMSRITTLLERFEFLHHWIGATLQVVDK